MVKNAHWRRGRILCGRIIENVSSREVFLCNKVSAVNRAEFVSGRMSCTVLRGRLCNIIVLNVRALTDADRLCGDF